MAKILITGGAGYIGSHVALEFLSAGHDVSILDNFCNSSAGIVDVVREISKKKVALFPVDILDGPALERVFQGNKYDGVIHCAGLKSVSESVQNPLKYYENNVTGTINLLQTMRAAGVSLIVFSSSATVYGQPSYLPLDEAHSVNPVNPYGETKLAVEHILDAVGASDENFRSATLRYFNPAGADKSGRLGEQPKGVPANLVPFVSQVAAGLRDKINVFGDDYETPDGTGVRDYIHILDLASAHLKAFDYLQSGGNAFTLNVGTGVGYSVLDVIKCFEAASGQSLDVNMTGRRAGDVASCYADASLAEKLLGWRAIYGLEDMCEDQWRWQVSLRG